MLGYRCPRKIILIIKTNKMKQKTYWIVIASDGDYALATISYTRKDAIFSWLEGTKLNWKKDSKKYGWKVEKVTIDIKPVKTLY